MDRRGFLKFAFGVTAAGAATIAAAKAAPLAPQALTDKPVEPDQIPQNAVAHDDDLKDAQLEQVRWGRRRWRRRWGWRRRRYWGFRRRYWRRRRYWGWRRRRRFYRRRYWRPRRYYW